MSSNFQAEADPAEWPQSQYGPLPPPHAHTSPAPAVHSAQPAALGSQQAHSPGLSNMLPLHAGVPSGGTLVAGLPKRSCSAVGVKQDLEGAPLKGQLGERAWYTFFTRLTALFEKTWAKAFLITIRRGAAGRLCNHRDDHMLNSPAASNF
ncbi:MAG: hypothetical protein FRX49_04927 [Trebouxia sp. A1-2]|nr:MAG: hypothetical protein FRX49_04927 [Trebouxia sp. A1-2]